MRRRVRFDGTPYLLLRYLTLPVVAVTTSAEGRRNGFIANSAQRASLVPTIARISLYVSKPNFSHDLMYRSGIFGIHLLRTEQWDVIRALGLRSGRDVPDKLDDLDVRTGISGCPMLDDCIAAFECRVINAMDAGAATFFLGEVVDFREDEPGPIMTSPYFRRHMPDDVRARYEANLAAAQRALAPLSGTVTPRPWPGAKARP
jgi:flavin reductase (DIM6/NTAB) family NADH-FMN oxidoreductase RutF